MSSHTPKPLSHRRSQRAFAKARQVMPGGVNSPVRAYKSVGQDPIFIRKGKGATVTDVDGHRYIDYVGSYGPLILGHAHPKVVAAVRKAAGRGASFGMPTEGETELARMIIAAVPSIEVVRLVNSGTEATMSAIRLARATTARPRIIKCTGCYHGHSDALLVQAGSGAMTFGVPSSPGVPASVTQNTILVPYNDLPAVEAVLKQYPDSIAAMVVEPIAGNMGCIPPVEGYLAGLRKLCDQYGALLLLDEVMTGFRVAYGGAQQLYKVKPDLTCLGKIVGGGLPCAAYGGREDLMRQVAPDGPMYQAGTLSGNPLAVAAGIATLTRLSKGRIYQQLEETSSALATGLKNLAAHAGVPVYLTRVGSMVCCFFNPTPIYNYEQALSCDTKAFTVFFGSMLDGGVVLPPSQFETFFVGAAHDSKAISKTLRAAAQAFAAVAKFQGRPAVAGTAGGKAGGKAAGRVRPAAGSIAPKPKKAPAGRS